MQDVDRKLSDFFLPRDAQFSGVNPDSFTIGAQRAMSAFTSRANSAGLVPPISNDSLPSPALTSLVSSAARTERLRPSAIARGVFAGTKMPCHSVILSPG